MTDTAKLERAIAKSERSRANLALMTDLSAEAFDAKVCGRAEFTASEIFILSKLLDLGAEGQTPEEIFFAKEVDY